MKNFEKCLIIYKTVGTFIFQLKNACFQSDKFIQSAYYTLVYNVSGRNFSKTRPGGNRLMDWLATGTPFASAVVRGQRVSL